MIAWSELDEEVRLLSIADTFGSLSDEVIEELARRGHDVCLKPGEVFFTPQEEHPERLFILKEGRIRIYRKGPERREMDLLLEDQGTIFGEMTLTAQRLREAYAQAVEPSIVFVLSREEVKDLMHSHPEIGLCLISQLCERLSQLVLLTNDLS